MKILILTDRLDIGGAETHIAQLAKSLLESGEEVFVASSGGATADYLEQIGIPQLRMPLGTHCPSQLVLLHRKIRTFIKREGIDVAHAHARIPAFLIRGVRRLATRNLPTNLRRFEVHT